MFSRWENEAFASCLVFHVVPVYRGQGAKSGYQAFALLSLQDDGARQGHRKEKGPASFPPCLSWINSGAESLMAGELTKPPDAPSTPGVLMRTVGPSVNVPEFGKAINSALQSFCFD